MNNANSTISVFIGQNSISLLTTSTPFYTESVICIPYMDTFHPESPNWISSHRVVLAITPHNDQVNCLEVMKDHLQRFQDYILVNTELLSSDELDNMQPYDIPQIYSQESIAALKLGVFKKAEALKYVLESVITDHYISFSAPYTATDEPIVDLPPIHLQECDLCVRLNKTDFSFVAITAKQHWGYTDSAAPVLFEVEQAELDKLAGMFDKSSLFKQMIMNTQTGEVYDMSDMPF